jgi:transposase InsO family protein
MGSAEVLDALYSLLLNRSKPEYLWANNEPEFTSEPFKEWLIKVWIRPIQIHPGSPWGNSYNEHFNGTLRSEALNVEWFTTTRQAQTVINQWLR